MEELVKKAKNDDKDAYSELVLNIKEELFNIASSKLDSEADVQDAIQETLVKAYLNIKNLRNNKYFKTWAIKILINECNRIYEAQERDKDLKEKYTSKYEQEEISDNDFTIEDIKKILTEKEKQIFSLYYEQGYTTKQISKLLNISENTIKSRIRLGKEKIKKSYKAFFIIIFICCVLISVVVIGAGVIGPVQDLFKTNTNGQENTGVLEAIEALEWFQKNDMDYIDLGEGYKIKLSYLSLDEMNLYVVFELKSEKDISKYNEFSILDLKIINENGELICDTENILNNQYNRLQGEKNIESTSNSMKHLIYMYTDSFPISNNLNISFSKIVLHRKKLFGAEIATIDSEANILVNISEKFKNRSHISYIANKDNIKKALISETGFYAIVNLNNIEKIDAKLIDENGTEYNCFTAFINNYDSNSAKEYIIISKYNDKNAKKLKLMINGIEYELNNT